MSFDIRRELNVNRALFLGYKYHQQERKGITDEHTRRMPEVHDESQYNHGKRREVEPVWFEVLHETLLEEKLQQNEQRNVRKGKALVIISRSGRSVGIEFEMGCLPKMRP